MVVSSAQDKKEMHSFLNSVVLYPWRIPATVRKVASMVSPKGSQGLIGWLQQTRGRLGTMDVTEEFEKSLANVVNGDDTLLAEYDYLFVPGYLWRWCV